MALNSFWRRSSRGFTLMELLIVMVLAGIILSIAAPSFTDFRRNSRLTGTANDLLAAMQLARTEAIKRQRNVAVCTSSAPAAPGAICSGGNIDGWIVFEDTNGDCQRGAGETLIRHEGPLDHTLRANSDGSCTAFAPTGFALDLAAGVEASHVLVCDDRGTALQSGTAQTAARGIEISRTGRAHITRDPDTIASWGISCST